MKAVRALALRAGLTYLDAVLGLAAGLTLAGTNVSTIKTLLVSAAPAAITVLRNGLAQLGVPGVPTTLPDKP